MLEITQWLDREARRERRRPSLEAALLSRNLWPYILYRLQYFSLRLAARLVVHLVTFLFLYRVFPRTAFVATAAAHALAAFSASFWWGGLETLRGRIRALHRNGQPHLIEFEVARWLSLAGKLAACVLGLAVVWCVWRAIGARGLGPVDLYQTVIFVRLALQIVTLTLHSGVFAIRRIYRPPWAIVAVELAGFAAALVFWPIAGTWGLPIASLAAALISTVIVVAYTLEAYRMIGLPSRSLLHAIVGASVPTNVSWRESGAAGVANAAMKMDALLVLAASGLVGFGERWPRLVVLFYLLSPVVRAAQDWAQLFYFDLKRLEPSLLASIRTRYDELVSALAWWVGASLWVLGGLLIIFAFQAPPPRAYLFLFPVFLVRSSLSMAQLRAFVAGRYGAALASAAAWIAGTVLLGNSQGLPGAMAAGGLLAWALPARARGRDARAGSKPAVLPVVRWLAELGAADAPIRIRAVEVLPRAGRQDRSTPAATTWWITIRIARRIAKRLGDAGAATAIWPNRVAWRERGAADRVSREWLVRVAAGRLTDVVDTGVRPDGRRALEHARASNLFDTAAMATPAVSQTHDVAADLTRRFETLCPGGITFSTDAAPPARLTMLSNGDKRRILSEAVAFARDFRPAHERSFYDVTALAIDGSVRTIFIQRARTDRRRCGRWRALVRDANVTIVTAAAHTSPG